MDCRRFLLVLLAAVASQGCMYFNGEELPRREGPETIADPPVVTFEIGEVKLLRNGEPSQQSAESIGSRELANTLRIWESRGLIRDWGRRTELSALPDYSLALTGSQNEEGSVLAAYVTGLSLYLVPSSTTWHYDWQFVLTDLRSGASYRVPVERSASVWVHAVFLPVLPFGSLGQYNGHRDQALYVYTELEKQGAFADANPTEMAAPPPIEPESD